MAHSMFSVFPKCTYIDPSKNILFSTETAAKQQSTPSLGVIFTSYEFNCLCESKEQPSLFEWAR